MSSDVLSPSPTILIVNLPPKSLVGIDLLSFTSPPSFHGIKDLPAGAHFLYTGTTESFSLRSGEWIFVPDTKSATSAGGAGSDIKLRRWDNSLETLLPIDEETDEGRQEAMERRANLGQIWRSPGLLAYQSRLSDTKGGTNAGATAAPAGDWDQLTDCVSPALLERILGSGQLAAGQNTRWMVTSGSSAACDTDHIPGLLAPEVRGAGGVAGEQETELRFLPVDLKKTWREGAIGRERTEAALDRSWALGDLIDRFGGEAQCLGEMQFAFVMVLTLMNFSCLEQWKRLLGLFLTCRAALLERESFFVRILRVLKLQLSHCEDVEGGLFEMDGDDRGSLLKSLLTGFKEILEDVIGATESPIKPAFEELERWVQAEYGWELSRRNIVRRGKLQLEDGEEVELDMDGAEEEDESGDYAPVVVDLEGTAEESPDVDMVDTPER
jgi:A1 cistron-splicing factor AAR2